MAKYSLIQVQERKNGRVSGYWIQDCVGTIEEAFERKEDTEKANSNRIEIAIVEQLTNGCPRWDYIRNIKEIEI